MLRFHRKFFLLNKAMSTAEVFNQLSAYYLLLSDWVDPTLAKMIAIIAEIFNHGQTQVPSIDGQLDNGMFYVYRGD